MVIATERRRDLSRVRRHDTERGYLSMQSQFTTFVFGDARLPAHFWEKA
jgi:hypothetical protein